MDFTPIINWSNNLEFVDVPTYGNNKKYELLTSNENEKEDFDFYFHSSSFNRIEYGLPKIMYGSNHYTVGIKKVKEFEFIGSIVRLDDYNNNKLVVDGPLDIIYILKFHKNRITYFYCISLKMFVKVNDLIRSILINTLYNYIKY